jgi:hypothetical protein
MAVSSGKIYLMLVVALFGLLGLLMLYGAWHYSSETQNFMKEAITATGKIAALKGTTSKDSKGRTSIVYHPTHCCLIDFPTIKSAEKQQCIGIFHLQKEKLAG